MAKRYGSSGGWWSAIGEGLSTAGGALDEYARNKADKEERDAEKAERKAAEAKRAKQGAQDDYDRNGRWDDEVLGAPPSDRGRDLKIPMMSMLGSGVTQDVKGGSYFKKDPTGGYRDVRKTAEFEQGKMDRAKHANLLRAQIALRDYAGPGLDQRDKTEIEGATDNPDDIKQMMVQRMGATRAREEEAIRNARELAEQKKRDEENRRNRAQARASAKRVEDAQLSTMEQQRREALLNSRATRAFDAADGNVGVAMKILLHQMPGVSMEEQSAAYQALKAVASARAAESAAAQAAGQVSKKVSPRAMGGSANGTDWQGQVLDDNY